MSKLGDNIRDFRVQKGLTQDQLAKKLSKSKNVVSNWERGENRPDADTIELLCGILEVSPNELLDWDRRQETVTVAAHLPTGVELTDEEHEQLDEYVQFLLSRRKK